METDGEDVTPGKGIDDGFFDEKNETDGRGNKIPLPEYPRHNSRRGSIPSVFPYSPPDYGGPGIVSKNNMNEKNLLNFSIF